MMNKISIRSRIVIAFTLIALFVGGAFTIGIYSIFDSTETELMSLAMDTKLKLIVANETHSNQTLSDLGLHLYSSRHPDPTLPKVLEDIPVGFSEIKTIPITYFAYRKVIDEVDYTLVLDQSLFENGFEHNVFLALKSGLFLTIVLGGLGGWFLARQILAPIVKLSELFARRTINPLAKEEFKNEFSDDEIGSLANAFEDAYAKVRDTLWRERLFTSDVSHEFRSGLMIISSSCEILLKEKSKLDADYDKLEKIARASAEMQQLIQSLLVLARAEHTAVNPSQTQTLEKIAREAFNRWQPDFQKKNIRLDLVIQGTQTHKKYNADFVLTALSNLLKNALNYTETGKVEIILNETSISIVDTGMGIDSVKQSRVMQPFVRGSALPLDGMGMGLSLIQRICENQGWRLNLYSSPGKGSNFTINF